MASSPSSRLFWLIVLSIFFPVIAVGMEFGFSKKLALNFVLNVVIPVALIVSFQENLYAMAGAQLSSLAAVVQSIYWLCMNRHAGYQPTDIDLENNQEEAAAPPAYNADEAPASANSTSKSGLA